MNTTLFKPIKDLSIQVHTKNKIFITPPIAVYESISELLEMINWLGQEAIEDKRVTEEKMYTDPAINRRPPLRESLSIRLGSRTLSYVNHLYLLNGILKAAHKRTLGFLNEHNLNEHIDQVYIDKEIKRLDDIFKPIKTFRHKVAAIHHLANLTMTMTCFNLTHYLI